LARGACPFLKSRKPVAVVRPLAEQRSGSAACLAAGVSDAELPAYASALDTLAQTGMITERSAP
jgi:putative mycofactocin binding protein MftB